MRPTQPSYPIDAGVFFLGVKWPGHGGGHSLPSNAMIKIVWSYTCTPLCVFMAQRLIKHRYGFFTFILIVWNGCIMEWTCLSVHFHVSPLKPLCRFWWNLALGPPLSCSQELILYQIPENQLTTQWIGTLHKIEISIRSLSFIWNIFQCGGYVMKDKMTIVYVFVLCNVFIVNYRYVSAINEQ